MPVLASLSSFVGRRVSQPRAPVCLVVKRVGSVSYTPRVGTCLVVRQEGVSLTRPVLIGISSRVGGEFLLHAP